MLPEKYIEIGRIAEAAHLPNLIDRQLILSLQKLLRPIQTAQIQKFMQRTSGKHPQISIQLGSANGKLPGNAFRGNVVHVVLRNVAKYVLDVKFEVSIRADFIFGTNSKQHAQKESECDLLFFPSQSILFPCRRFRHREQQLRLSFRQIKE